jgi:hypothetical protein
MNIGHGLSEFGPMPLLNELRNALAISSLIAKTQILERRRKQAWEKVGLKLGR